MTDETTEPRSDANVAPEPAAEVAPKAEPPTPLAELADAMRAAVAHEGVEVRYFNVETRHIGIGTPSAYIIAQRTGVRWRLTDVRAGHPAPTYAEPGELKQTLGELLKVKL